MVQLPSGDILAFCEEEPEGSISINELPGWLISLSAKGEQPKALKLSVRQADYGRTWGGLCHL